MSVPLWLACYEDGAWRLHRRGEREAWRRRRLRTPDWFIGRLQEHGGPRFHTESLYQLGGGGMQLPLIFPQYTGCDKVSIVGLMRVSNRDCVCADGLLTNWSMEAELLRWYIDGLFVINTETLTLKYNKY